MNQGDKEATYAKVSHQEYNEFLEWKAQKAKMAEAIAEAAKKLLSHPGPIPKGEQ